MLLIFCSCFQVVRTDSFNLIIRDCPPGYVLSSVAQGFVTCECDFDNPNIVDCEGKTILLAVRLYEVVWFTVKFCVKTMLENFAILLAIVIV